MSKIFFGVIKPQNNTDIEILKSKLKVLFGKNNLFVYYSFSYVEPCISHIYENEQFITFSISDNQSFDNCEMLLLPDNNMYNNRVNTTPLLHRMQIIQNIFENLHSTPLSIELFIGESGIDYYDFEKKTLSVTELASTLAQAINALDFPAVHYILEK